MAEITEAGYETLRAAVEDGWTWIELQDTSGKKIVRRQIGTAGSGAYVSPREHDGQVVMFRVVVIGSDDDMPEFPVVVRSSVLKNADSDTAPALSTEQLKADFTFQDDDDQLTVYHGVAVPMLLM